MNFTHINSIGFLLGIFSIFIGIKYPDWDFKLKLKHRSILTHSPVILILFTILYMDSVNSTWWFMGEKEIGFRYFIIGFSIGMGIHFLYDLFPKGWKGSALLHIPIVNRRVKEKGTILLFTLFTGTSLGFAAFLCKTPEEIFLFILFGFLLLVLNKRKEGKIIRPGFSFLFIFLSVSYILKKEFILDLINWIFSLIEIVS